jgi:hypothetical protein
MPWRIPHCVRLQIAAEPAFLGRAEVAKKYGVSETVVRSVRKEFQIKPNPRGMPAGTKIKTFSSHRKDRPIGWPCKPLIKPALSWAL